jgi:predicted CoA-binding protein
MTELEEAARDFLSQRRFAVAGVSRSSSEAANLIFRKLRDSGREVYPVNPRTTEVEGVACYSNLESLPHPIDALVIATPPSVTKTLVDRCAELGIRHVWMHRSFAGGSVSTEAVDACRKHGIRAIPGACPMMFCEPVDAGHKCIRWIAKLTGRLPKRDLTSEKGAI